MKSMVESSENEVSPPHATGGPILGNLSPTSGLGEDLYPRMASLQPFQPVQVRVPLAIQKSILI